MKSVKYAVLTAAIAAMLVQGAPVRASETSDNIVSSFQESYVYRTFLADDSVKIEAKEGVVTLTGTVADASHRKLAQDTAENIPGVARVDNQLETKAEVDAENSDKWIGRKVTFGLMFHRNVSAGRTKVDVKDGVVTLTGEASSIGQKDLTSEYARDIVGVKEVINQMTVASKEAMPDRTAGEKLDDASVTAQVKTALSNHRSTSAINTAVTSRNGEVTLTGIAHNAAEKALVTKLVNDVHGVSSVKNDMTIEAAKTM